MATGFFCLRVGFLMVLATSVEGAEVEGESAVDEPMLTGESLPAEKRPRRAVFAGIKKEF